MFFLWGTTMTHALPTPATRLRVIVWSQAPGQSDVRSHRDHPASDTETHPFPSSSMVQLRCQNCPILPLGKTTDRKHISKNLKVPILPDFEMTTFWAFSRAPKINSAMRRLSRPNAGMVENCPRVIMGKVLWFHSPPCIPISARYTTSPNNLLRTY